MRRRKSLRRIELSAASESCSPTGPERLLTGSVLVPRLQAADRSRTAGARKTQRAAQDLGWPWRCIRTLKSSISMEIGKAWRCVLTTGPR